MVTQCTTHTNAAQCHRMKLRPSPVFAWQETLIWEHWIIVAVRNCIAINWILENGVRAPILHLSLAMVLIINLAIKSDAG